MEQLKKDLKEHSEKVARLESDMYMLYRRKTPDNKELIQRVRDLDVKFVDLETRIANNKKTIDELREKLNVASSKHVWRDLQLFTL